MYVVRKRKPISNSSAVRAEKVVHARKLFLQLMVTKLFKLVTSISLFF